MNFLSNVLNSIPVVGHVKGGIHYLAGDEEGGHRAIYQSTRTSAVMAGGAAGLVLGPAGAAVGAVYGGLATDLLASGVSGKPQGLVENCESVGKDIAAGRNPMGSIASTGFQIALDGVGGLGMGGVSSAASQISEKAVANSIQNVGKKVVSAVGEEVLEKTFQVSAKEVTKAIGKKASERVVKQVIQQTAMAAEVALVSTHVARTASKQTEQDEEKERQEVEERYRRERERERRERQEREEREGRDRERREREERERRERQEREERERRDREMREREERVRREREERERLEREVRDRREREERERQANEERELRERLEREWRANREREERIRRERERQNNTSQNLQGRQTVGQQNSARPTTVTNQQSTTQGTSSGSSSGTPEGNNNNNNNNNNNKKKKKRKTDKEILDEFMLLLQRVLRNIYGTAEEPISRIFSKTKLAKHGPYLSKVLRTIDNFDLLEAVLDTVIKMFKDHMSEDLSIENFISLLEFARSYLNEKIDELQTDSTLYPEGTYEERRALILRDIRAEPSLITEIVALFKRLAAEIRTVCEPPNNIIPDFRDIFAKVYHYYKHRCVPELPDYEQKNIEVPDDVREYLPEDGILSVRQYFYWARTLLERLRNHPRYVAEVVNQPPPTTCIYEIYIVLFGHRFRVVVKVRRGPRNIPVFVTSTVFVDDSDYEGDEESGYEDMKIEKK